MVRNFYNQNYRKLKRDLIQRREQFTDTTFPPDVSSLYYSHQNDPGIVWKRPAEICEDPHLVVKGLSASDLNQGTLGNCWFIAACSALALERRLWEKVVVNHTEQEWDPDHPENYAGIFHFHIWQFGEWVDVVIDDYLPTMNGKLIYAKSQDANEFWSAFLEKAFAKLAGSYEALAGGFTSEALIDFTGGVSEVIPLNYFTDENDRDKKNFDYIIEAHEHQAMISCSIALAEGDQVDQIMDCGLVKGHAYTVVAVKRMKLETGLRAFFNNKEKLMMVKMRNPWGKKEWNGPWSDDSKEWNRVPKSEQDKMELKVENDGEFWMEFHDWRTFFTHCTVCHIVNTRVLTLRKTWNDSIFHGKWQGRSAGGSVNNLDTFFNNPQYSFTLREEQEIMVSLMQKDPRANRRRRDTTRADPAPAFTIGFLILKVEVNRDHRIHRLRAEAGRVTFINMRQVFGRFKLSQGRYCIIPSTFEPNQEREFLLRIYTEQNVRAREWKTDAPSRGIGGFLCPCCVKPYRGMVSVHVHRAQGLAKQDLTGAGADPYCKIKCNGKTAVTPVSSNTLDPNFDSHAVFYVKRPQDAMVKVQVINHGMIRDRFMGQVTAQLPAADGDGERRTMTLMDRSNNVESQGSISFSVTHHSNLRAT